MAHPVVDAAAGAAAGGPGRLAAADARLRPLVPPGHAGRGAPKREAERDSRIFWVHFSMKM